MTKGNLSMASRRLKGQTSLIRMAEEGTRMLRAADDLAKIKSKIKKYKKSGYEYYGVTIGKSDAGRGRLCLSDRLPKEEADMVVSAINDTINNCRLTLAQKATEVISGSVISIQDEIRPPKDDVAIEHEREKGDNESSAA